MARWSAGAWCPPPLGPAHMCTLQKAARSYSSSRAQMGPMGCSRGRHWACRPCMVRHKCMDLKEVCSSPSPYICACSEAAVGFCRYKYASDPKGVPLWAASFCSRRCLHSLLTPCGCTVRWALNLARQPSDSYSRQNLVLLRLRGSAHPRQRPRRWGYFHHHGAPQIQRTAQPGRTWQEARPDAPSRAFGGLTPLLLPS